MGKAFAKIFADVSLTTFPTTSMASSAERRHKKFCQRLSFFTLLVSFQPSPLGSLMITTPTAKLVRLTQMLSLNLYHSTVSSNPRRRQESDNGPNDWRPLFCHFWWPAAFDSSDHRPIGSLHQRSAILFFYYSIIQFQSLQSSFAHLQVISSICDDFELDFYAMYGCVGLWCAFFLFIISLFNVSRLMRWCTRSTEEIFGLFISVAFCVDACRDTAKSKIFKFNCSLNSFFNFALNVY